MRMYPRIWERSPKGRLKKRFFRQNRDWRVQLASVRFLEVLNDREMRGLYRANGTDNSSKASLSFLIA